MSLNVETKIVVGKRWDPGAIYIGRGSPLGNPFVIQTSSQAERDRVCDAYETWFAAQVDGGNPSILNELRRLYRLARKGTVILGCFCAPLRCHGSTIKRFLDSKARLAGMRVCDADTD